MISSFVIAETKEVGHRINSALSAHGIVPFVVIMKPGSWLARAACRSFPAARQEFGSLVRKARTDRGLTQRGLADLVGMNYTYVSKLESGTVPLPNPGKFRRIIGALDISEEELIRVSYAPFVMVRT